MLDALSVFLTENQMSQSEPRSVVDRVAERLAPCPWVVLSIAGRQFWLKKHFGAGEYALLVTDLVRVWAERREAGRLEHMHRMFNPKLAFVSAEATLQRLDAKLEPAWQHLLAWREDTPAALQWELSIHVSNLLNFCWLFELEAVEAGRAAGLLRGLLLEPLLGAAQELGRQCGLLWSELARKDAELAALARRGHKAERSVRTERLASAALEQFAEGELRARPRPPPPPLDGPLDLFLRHFVAAAAPAPEEPAPEQPPQPHSHSQAAAAAAAAERTPLSQPLGPPASLSLSPPPPAAAAAAADSAPLSPHRGGVRGPAVVVDGGAKKKQKVVSRKNAFV